MLKKFLFPFLTILVVCLIYAFNNPSANFKIDGKEGVQFFRGTWDSAVKEAKLKNKIIFLDIYATWCGPCKKLKARTFSSNKVGDYFNEHFINVSLDGELGDGEILANKYKLQSYPSIFFIDTTGKVLQAGEGYYNANEIIRFAKKLR
jgi:thioredoxin 1